MSTLKQGKKPLSTKPSQSVLTDDDVFGNALTISSELKAELEDQGLSWRFIDSKRLYEMNGYNDKGWEPYKRRNATIQDKQDFRFGKDPEGVVRRGSLILAVKSKEKAELHRNYLRQKAERYSHFNRKKADELRAFARENRVESAIHEGFEENDD